MFILYLRCVDDGYCSQEHADLIQKYVEKKLGKLYKIDETIGKSLVSINEDDEYEEEPKDRKAMIISDDDDESSHLSPNGNTNSHMTETTKHISSNNNDDDDDNNVNLSPSLTTNNRLSPSPPVPSPSKGNPSPGEIITKAISPSSLSEASPILD